MEKLLEEKKYLEEKLEELNKKIISFKENNKECIHRYIYKYVVGKNIFYECRKCKKKLEENNIRYNNSLIKEIIF